VRFIVLILNSTKTAARFGAAFDTGGRLEESQAQVKVANPSGTEARERARFSIITEMDPSPLDRQDWGPIG